MRAELSLYVNRTLSGRSMWVKSLRETVMSFTVSLMIKTSGEPCYSSSFILSSTVLVRQDG